MKGKEALAFAVLTIASFSGVSLAWSPCAHPKLTSSFRNNFKTHSTFSHSKLYTQYQNDKENDELGTFFPDPKFTFEGNRKATVGLNALAISALTLNLHPLSASAAVVSSGSPIPSALAAYGHYLSLFVMVGAIMVERLTVKPNMSTDEEKTMVFADITLGVTAVGLLLSGYYRATAYGKGWDFYSHEPLFWAKMTFLGVLSALSLFPTITIIKRSITLQTDPDSFKPMSEALAKRMTSILNAELSALVFIPLTATFMARGIGYVDDFPTQIVGPVITALVTGGAGFLYVKEALTWQEE